MNRLFDGRWNADWPVLLKAAAILGVGWFFVFFLYTYLRLRASEPAEEILAHEPSQPDGRSTQLSGFVAMEYYDLILNRTFVVFIAPEGLYGWKAEGPVTAASPTYFEPYADMLKDPELMQNREAVKKLSQLKGGFFIPRSDIVAADVVYKQRWGMGSIPHSGGVRIRLTSRKCREFVLLGSVDGETIQQRIVLG